MQAGTKHVGNCGLSDIDRRRRKAQLWIYLGESTGRGIGTLAIRHLLRRGFEELEVNRVYLRVLTNNRGAINFYLALGFTQEGVWREDTVQNTRFVDSVWFSMLEREYYKRGKIS